MSDQLATAAEHQERLVELLDRYVGDLERGEALSIEAYADRHAPQDSAFRSELLECLEGVAAVFVAVESARQDSGAKVARSSPTADEPPRQIGDYRLVREVGRGGMGVVYEAEERSLRRRVALKVLPFAAVLDERQITRFRNEAQAAAGLHHANIVPVFAIGQERGVHYYAMQYIEGRSLAQAITELRRDGAAAVAHDATTAPANLASVTPTPGPASPIGASTLGADHETPDFFRTAAGLMADAADALQHAHDLGVVHRDVKPSNLLIDQRGKLWVADFGLARMQTDLGVTATGDVVGTLRYMSPEQARGRADQVDGRTDVYALGATLYELLTLNHAHPGDDRRSLLDRLEKAEPTPPRRLNQAVPADLENIVLRAMEKDPGTRYATAGQLRDDLRRFLSGKPTIARPPTVVDRLVKWGRRHQRGVAVAAAMLVVVTVVALASGLLVNAARQRAEAALADSKRQSERAERLLDQARSVLDRFGGELSDQLAGVPGAELVRVRALEDTLEYYRYFLDESAGDPRFARSSAETSVRAGAVSEQLGDLDGALRLYEEAAAELGHHLNDSPEDHHAKGWLARCLTNHGLLLSTRGEAAIALEELDRAVALRRELLRSAGATDASALSQLAAALCDRAGVSRDRTRSLHDLEEALSLLVEARGREPGEAHLARRQAIALYTKASLIRTKDPAAAQDASERSILLLKDLAAEHPEVDAYRDDLAVAWSIQGALARDARRWADAAAAHHGAGQELARLAERSPRTPRRWSELAVADASLGFALAMAGRTTESDNAFDAAEATLRKLVASYPAVGRYRKSLAALVNNRGVALRDCGRFDEAAMAFARSVRLEEERIAQDGGSPSQLLAQLHANHAAVLVKLGRFEEAARIETRRRAMLDSAANTPAVVQDAR